MDADGLRRYISQLSKQGNSLVTSAVRPMCRWALLIASFLQERAEALVTVEAIDELDASCFYSYQSDGWGRARRRLCVRSGLL